MKKAVLLMVIAGTGVAFAQPKDAPKKGAPPPAMVKPTPAKELEVTKAWIKTWACTATNPAGEKVLGKLAIKKELDGMWMSIKFDTQKTRSDLAFSGMAMFGIDPVSKGWVLTGYDNMGGWINLKGKEATATSMIWEGNAGSSRGQMPTRFTFALDNKKLKFVGEFGGKKAFEHDCK
jgi:hypothetical protein